MQNNTNKKPIPLAYIITCNTYAAWLHAAHLRTKHMHIVVRAPKEPEKVAVSFKAYATRYLKQYHPELNRQRYWSRGESTGYIFRSDYLLRAIQYTVEEQGREMACYCDPSYYDALECLSASAHFHSLLT